MPMFHIRSTGNEVFDSSFIGYVNNQMQSFLSSSYRVSLYHNSGKAGKFIGGILGTPRILFKETISLIAN